MGGRALAPRGLRPGRAGDTRLATALGGAADRHDLPRDHRAQRPPRRLPPAGALAGPPPRSALRHRSHLAGRVARKPIRCSPRKARASIGWASQSRPRIAWARLERSRRLGSLAAAALREADADRTRG